jgi:hypothetical protein
MSEPVSMNVITFKTILSLVSSSICKIVWGLDSPLIFLTANLIFCGSFLSINLYLTPDLKYLFNAFNFFILNFYSALISILC